MESNDSRAEESVGSLTPAELHQISEALADRERRMAVNAMEFTILYGRDSQPVLAFQQAEREALTARYKIDRIREKTFGRQ